MGSLYGFIAWVQCMGSLYGFSVWDQCMGSLLACLESAYSLIWVSHEIWGKCGGDTLALS